MYGNLSSLNIQLAGAELEPDGPAWARATEAERRIYWAYVGSSALSRKRSELGRGIDANGDAMQPVKRASRPDGAGGPPLSPHDAASRTQRLLAMTSTARGATLYWRSGWKTILGYHAIMNGPRALPVRDVIGLSPGGVRVVLADARRFWKRYSMGVALDIEGEAQARIKDLFKGTKAAGSRLVNLDLATLHSGTRASVEGMIRNGTFTGFRKLKPFVGGR